MPYLYQSGFATFICLGVLPPYVWCAASVSLGVLPPSGHIASIRHAVSVWVLCLWDAVSVCEELSVLWGAMCQADQRHLSQTLELCMLRWTWETGDFAAPWHTSMCFPLSTGLSWPLGLPWWIWLALSLIFHMPTWPPLPGNPQAHVL